jgi:signal transduction histidine kinase
MDRMTTSANPAASAAERLRANWPALLLPLVAADTLGLFAGPVLLLVILTVFLALLAPLVSAQLVPYAFFGYGGYGLFKLHSLMVWEAAPVVYGVVRAGTNDNAAYVLPQAIAFLAAGIWLLVRTGTPGGGVVRRAVAQLRGADGQPRTVPPVLLLPVIFLWEELFNAPLWFGPGSVGKVMAILIVVVAIALAGWLPQAAVALAVAGLALFGLLGLYGVVEGARGLWEGVPWQGFSGAGTAWFYGAVPLNGTVTWLLAAVQGLVLLGIAWVLTPPVLAWGRDAELARRARALAQRVDRLTQTRADATEVAVAELRRIERDLHDGAQARLVAVGMSLRAAEELMRANPEAALSLVAEARETSSRALDDLRGLVRGIYPPVLADRGLADAIRSLALDVPLPVDVDIDLPGSPPMPVAAAVYFGVAEALTNAARHAAAQAAQLSLGYADGMLRARIIDDGQGGADPAAGTGLRGVELRLATFDGILAVSSPAGGPTIVAIEVPCALSSAKISSC